MTLAKTSLLLRTTIGLLAALGSLSGCGGDVKKSLGMERVAPDEFRVVSRPPLTVPPQFTLLPPDIDAEPPGQLPTTERARNMVLGTPIEDDGTASDATAASTTPATPAGTTGNGLPSPDKLSTEKQADSLFLKQAGAEVADPNIRKALVEERVSKQLTEEKESWWDKLSIEPKQADPTVNAGKEAERIQQNEDEGKPVTDGETPVVKPANRGILGNILGGD